MRVNIGQAKTDLSKLLARVEAGEDVEIARDGVPVARLVRIEPSHGPGVRFLAAHGALVGQIAIADDFELSESEIDRMLDGAHSSPCTTAILSTGCRSHRLVAKA